MTDYYLDFGSGEYRKLYKASKMIFVDGHWHKIYGYKKSIGFFKIHLQPTLLIDNHTNKILVDERFKSLVYTKKDSLGRIKYLPLEAESITFSNLGLA
jgi:hypothetical protein